MPRKGAGEKRVRGVFERPPGSGIWWINYYVRGKQHREKVGRKSDAIDLYRTRKTDARRRIKLPELRTGAKEITLSELIDDMLEATAKHRDRRNYESRGEIVRAGLGSVVADDLTPQELSRWLDKQCKTPATFNRYKALISLCYCDGFANAKVKTNPARLIRRRSEGQGRARFLSYAEYDKLLAVIRKRSRNMPLNSSSQCKQE